MLLIHYEVDAMLPVNSILQNRYQIIEQIGRGGMGAVYKAQDLRLGHIVALKETLVTGDIPRRAFEREARLLAGLRHRALPKVSDHFNEGDGQFLVMEFISGDDLGSLLSQREQPFPIGDVLRWADDLLEALDYLHAHNPPIVHRDIKPQNMKLTLRGEIILLDFGLAKGAASQATRSSSTGSIYGYTPHYAPLEQIQGTGTDIRSDLYALAATLHHLLTGTLPPDALTRAAAKISDNPDPLVPAHQLNPDVPPAIAAILMRAMSQKPDERYATAADMRIALQDAASGRQTGPIPDLSTRRVDQTGTMVIYPGSGTQAARPATDVLTAPQTSAGSTGTTVNTPPAPAGRPAWLFPLLGIIAIGAVVAGLFAGGVFNNTREPVPTAPLQAAAVATATIAAPTTTPEPTIDVLAAADATRTAQAVSLETARAILGSTDVAATEQAIDATEQAIGPTLTLLALTPA
ncbi:MAG TPA: serine/threonine-protein kinase, partial [Roseiflexaceae bacterium]|nr:serine/threonine-protein kinase [Roseiflexaceae bacterium]